MVNVTKNVHRDYFAHKMTRNRTLSNILGKDPRPVAKKITRKRAKVQCHCDKCKGKSVDPRTKERHELANRANREISSQ